VSQVMRARDHFVETRIRQESPHLSYWETLQEGLSQVELFFSEPGETGISAALDQMWDALQDLSYGADSDSVREVVVQRAEVLVEAIRNTRTQLQSLRADLNNNVQVLVSKVNTLARQIADLNNQIGKVSATGSHPNDLLDQRDMLLEELSKIADIEVVDDHANMVVVTLNGVGLVQRSSAYTLETYRVPVPEQGYDKYEVRWQATGNATVIKSGELGATLALRDQEVQNYIAELDRWTLDFAAAFNAIHQEGFTLNGEAGEAFFVFSPDPNTGETFAALSIAVNESIVQDPGKIAAAYFGEGEGWKDGHKANGANALRLAELRNKPPEKPTPWEFTVGDGFISIISNLGVRAERARKMAENRDVLVTHLQNLREATSGVNLDEEMANMIKFQHAYNAAARLMTAVDQTLDVLINRLGVVGR